MLQALCRSGDISLANYREAAAVTDLKLKRGKIYTRIHEPYFFDYVQQELIDKYGVTIAGGQNQLKGKIARIAHTGYFGAFANSADCCLTTSQTTSS